MELNAPFVYPNPLNGTSLHINTNSNNETVEVRIIDLTGKSVYQQITNKENITVDANVFSSGIYLVQIKNNQKVSTTKLLVNE